MNPLGAIVAKEPVRFGTRGFAVTTLQNLLRTHGHELVADGDFGLNTLAAVKRFQSAHGLTADGIVGPKTAEALERSPQSVPRPAAPSVIAVAPWLATLRAISGTKEVPGGKNNPEIMRWNSVIARRFPKFEAYTKTYNADSIPWCGHGEAFVMAENNIAPVEGYLWAQNWAKWGVKLDAPALGAVLVFKRDGGGHVGNYEGEDATHYHVRGCNQSDTINVTRIKKSQLVSGGIRWPAGFSLPSTGRVQKAAVGSTNESLQ